MFENKGAVAQCYPGTGQSNQFSSVSLSCGEGACTAARALAGRRQLLEEAPALPLERCSAKTCNCRYFRYGDRRSLLANRRGSRRADGRIRNWLWQKNRRTGEDRRKLKIDFHRWI